MFKKVFFMLLASLMFNNSFGTIYENDLDDLEKFSQENGTYPALDCILLGNRDPNARNHIILSFTNSEIVKFTDIGLQRSGECFLQPSIDDFDVVVSCFGRSISEEMTYLIREDATGIVVHSQIGQVAVMECALLQVEQFDEDYYNTQYGDDYEDYEDFENDL